MSRPWTGDRTGLLRLAERARAVGFDSIWVGDSLPERPRHEPLRLAAVVGHLPGIEVGTAVLSPALRNPAPLAQQVATLDPSPRGG